MNPDKGREIGRMERKKNANRQKIMDVAVDLFARQGYHNTTMEQIAEAADVARKTLYNYYPVKDAIADEYLRGISRGLAAESRDDIRELPDTRARLLHTLLKVYGWVAINPELSEVTIRYRMHHIYKQNETEYEATGTQTMVAEILRQGQLSGEITTQLPVAALVKYVDLLRGVVLMNWLQNPESARLEDKISEVLDLFLYGVSTHSRQNGNTALLQKDLP